MPLNEILQTVAAIYIQLINKYTHFEILYLNAVPDIKCVTYAVLHGLTIAYTIVKY